MRFLLVEWVGHVLLRANLSYPCVPRAFLAARALRGPPIRACSAAHDGTPHLARAALDRAGRPFLRAAVRAAQPARRAPRAEARLGRARGARGDALAGPGGEARLREPAQDAVPPAGRCRGRPASSRRAARCASRPRPTCSTFESALREGRVADALRAAPRRAARRLRRRRQRGVVELARLRARPPARGVARRRARAPGGRDRRRRTASTLSARLLEADPLDEAALRAHMAWLAQRRAGGARAPGLPRRSPRAWRRARPRAGRRAEGAARRARRDCRHRATVAAARAARPIRASSAARSSCAASPTLLAQDDCRLLTLIGPGGVGKTRLARRALPRARGELCRTAPSFVPLEDVASRTRARRSRSRASWASRLHRRRRAAGPGHRRSCASGGCCWCSTTSSSSRRRPPCSSACSPACPRLRIIVTSRVRLALAERMAAAARRACRAPSPRTRPRSRRSTRCACSSRRRNASSPRWCPRSRPRRSSTSAARSKACRWRWSSPPHGRACCRARRSPPSSRHGTELLHAVDARAAGAAREHRGRVRPVVAAAERRSSATRSRACRCSAAASRPKRRARSPAASLPVLGALADKSLLRKDGARLFLHPLVPAARRRRLATARRDRPRERAHARYFHRLLAQLRARRVERGDREALQSLDTEFENCRGRVALGDRARRRPRPLRRCVRTLFNFCDHRGRVDEGAGAAARSARCRGHRGRPEARGARCWRATGASRVPARSLRRGASRRRCARWIAARGARDRDAKAQCLNVLGDACAAARRAWRKRSAVSLRRAAARARDERSARRGRDARQPGARREVRWATTTKRCACRCESLAAHRRLGDVAGEALCLNNLAALYLDRQDPAAAGRCSREALAICERHGLVARADLLLANLTGLAMKHGRLSRPRRTMRGAPSTRARAPAIARSRRSLQLQFAQLALRRGDLAGRARRARGVAAHRDRHRPPGDAAGGGVDLRRGAGRAGRGRCARRVLGFVAEHPSVSARRRWNSARGLRSCPTRTSAPTWPALALDELVHRIVVESDARLRTADRRPCAPRASRSAARARGTLVERSPAHSSVPPAANRSGGVHHRPHRRASSWKQPYWRHPVRPRRSRRSATRSASKRPSASAGTSTAT